MSEDLRLMQAEAERKRKEAERLRLLQLQEQQRQAAAAEAAKAATPSHAEGYDEKRKTPKVYTGPKVKVETTIGETKPAAPAPVYHVGGSGPKFEETMKVLQTKADEFYSKGGFPTPDEVKSYLERVRPATGYVAAGDSPFKPKNIGEALNRMGYAITQMIIGGAIEETLPFSLSAMPPAKRESDILYRALGGLLTPSPADLFAGLVVTKLVKTVKGSQILKKLLGTADEVNLTPSEKKVYDTLIRGFEETPGRGGYSTAEIRAGIKKKYKTLQEIAEYYKEHPYTYGGEGTVPQLIQEYEDMLRNLGWDDMDTYYEFMRNRAPELPVGVLANILAGVSDTGESIEQTIIDLSNYTDRSDKYKFSPEEKVLLKDMAKTLLDQPVKPEQEQVPIVDQPVKPEQAQVPEQMPLIDTAVTPKPYQTDEPKEQPEPTLEPPLPVLTVKQQVEANTLRLRLWNGPKERYKVKFSYPAGRGETLTVEARSFPEAVNKGQRGRRGNRYLPSVVDVTRV